MRPPMPCAMGHYCPAGTAFPTEFPLFPPPPSLPIFSSSLFIYPLSIQKALVVVCVLPSLVRWDITVPQARLSQRNSLALRDLGRTEPTWRIKKNVTIVLDNTSARAEKQNPTTYVPLDTFVHMVGVPMATFVHMVGVLVVIIVRLVGILVVIIIHMVYCW